MKVKFLNLLSVIVAFGVSSFPNVVEANNHPSGTVNDSPIPFNSNFPKAQYPYAQAPDGCSIPGSSPGDYDSFAWLGNHFSFTKACNVHDRCYYTLNTTQVSCNLDFTKNLHKACYEGVSGNLSPYDVITGGMNRTSALTYCQKRANYISEAVSSTSIYFYNEAQKLQQAYEKYAEEIRTAPVFTMNFPAKFPKDSPLLKQQCALNREHGNIYQSKIGPILVENATSSPISVALYDENGNKQSEVTQINPQSPSWIPKDNNTLQANGDWAIQVGDGCLHYIGEEAQFSERGSYFYLRYSGKENPAPRPTSQDPACRRPRAHNNRFSTNTGPILVENATPNPINITLYDANGNKQSEMTQINSQSFPSWIPKDNNTLQATGDWAIQVGDGCLHYIGEEAQFSESGTHSSYFFLKYTGEK